MKNLELKIPPVAVWLICALIMWGIARLLPFGTLPPLPVVAMVVAGIGIGVSFAGVWSFRKARTTVNPLEPSQATHFCFKRGVPTESQPYVRRLGLLFARLGDMALLSFNLDRNPLFIAYMTRFQIIPEERILKLKFGKEYENYCLKVRRWL